MKIAKEVETRLRGKIVSLGDGIEGRVSGDKAAFVTFWNSKRDVADAINFNRIAENKNHDLIIGLRNSVITSLGICLPARTLESSQWIEARHRLKYWLL